MAQPKMHIEYQSLLAGHIHFFCISYNYMHLWLQTLESQVDCGQPCPYGIKGVGTDVERVLDMSALWIRAQTIVLIPDHWQQGPPQIMGFEFRHWVEAQH
jgi:hypothetical protein